MQGKSLELEDEIIIGPPCVFYNEKPKELKAIKIRKKKLHTFQVVSNYNLRGKSKSKSLVADYCKIEEAFSVCSWNAKQCNYGETKEASVSVRAWDAMQDNCGETKEASVSVRSWDAKQDNCGETKEALVRVHTRNVKQRKCGEIKEAPVSLYSWNVFRELNLDPHPVFVKLLCKAHAEAGFFLAIPRPFCKRHLPGKDTLVTLETDNGEQYEAKYLPRHSGLSAGWRGFAIDEKLAEGDLAVFHLVEPTRFKVYIMRKNSSTVKLPAAILDLCTKATQTVPEKDQLLVYKRRKARQPGEKSNEKSVIHFSNIRGFEDFNTVMNELLQTHDLSEATLHAYYELCRAQNAFLHAHLLKGLNTRFFVGAIRSIISNTVSIANTLRTCTICTFLDHLSQWNKTLKYYEALGMNVSLLKARVRHLRYLAVSSDGAVNGSRYMEACRECPRAEHEVRKLEIVLDLMRKTSTVLAAEVKTLETKGNRVKYLETHSRLIEVGDEIRKLEVLLAEFDEFFKHYHSVIETLKSKVNNHDRHFQEEASAPW